MEFPQLQELVDRALEDKKLTRMEMDQIVTAIRADGKVSPEEAQLLDSIRQMVLRREIQVVETAD
ncbi:hypothetical protein L1047_12065 [Synechococcus sp. Nb3U1]|jgi:hypothetical protein|uniref:hypothetical protein n=1 Tax=Synechococcus sp. Nb3U1 TaxID=1914529 RepID=UPI001F453E1A|nr:hypothetical protein [Synechococcus sp. Nb3U1]MCF2971930.1 hypothetical protein [Synechococcus sp. Nb3U1]